MRILIVEDHHLFIDGISVVLEQIPELLPLTIDSAHSMQAAIELVESNGQYYGLILSDLTLPDASGFDFIKLLSSKNITTNVIIISGSTGMKDLLKCYHLGAVGYISKNDTTQQIIESIQGVLKGKKVYPDSFWDYYIAQEQQQKLKSNISSRAMEVLHLIADGKSNKQIAEILDIQDSTVKFHIKALFNEFNVTNRTWVLREAIKQGYIKP